MASSSFIDSSENATPKSVTIMINENGEVNVDQDALKSILDSNQPSATVTFVRVGSDERASASGDGETVNVTIGEEMTLEPPASTDQGILMLDQEQMNRLENVLQSDAAKDYFGDVLGPADVSALAANIGDLLSGDGPTTASDVMDQAVPEDEFVKPLGEYTGDQDQQHFDHCYTMSKTEEQSDENSLLKKSSSSQEPKRRSQRQIDKEMKEEAERIRLENQAMLQKEREEAMKKSEEEEEIEEQEHDESMTMPSEADTSVQSTASETDSKGSKGRPKRERKVPAHLMTGDFESSFIKTPKPDTSAKKSSKEKGNDGEGDDDDDDEESSEEDEDWNSEDDPDKLWCICNQPHNNRFMICCDNCLDWFHGKCVGITKKMGKEMEEVGNEWRCPKCKKVDAEKEAEAKEEHIKEELKKTLKDRPEKNQQQIKSKKSKTIPRKALKPSGKLESAVTEPSKKVKERTCFVCEKPPKENSIYCSDECIEKHVNKAKVLLEKNRPKAASAFNSTNSNAPQQPKPSATAGKSQVLVLEPQTNTMLNGPNAPTENTLEGWLRAHPTFHVVMPSSMPTSKFYGCPENTTGVARIWHKQLTHQPSVHRGPKIIPPHKQLTPGKSLVDKKLAAYSSKPVNLQSARQGLSSSLITSAQKIEETERVKKEIEDIRRRRSSDSGKTHRQRRDSSHHITPTKKHRQHSTDISVPAPPPPPQNPKPIRDNATKGLREALKTRMKKAENVSISDEDLVKLVEEIEEALYKLYNKDVGHKYKAKYRSLVFNIKDEKNNGLFRKILTRKIGPKELVAMAPEDLASKELQQWREAELKQDIEKIKSYELEKLALGDKIVMKSHKGEEVIQSVAAPKQTDLKLPDEIPVDEAVKEEEGPKTWEHGSHSFDPGCDVCTGKRSLDDFLLAKMEKEKKEKRRKDRRHRSRSRDRRKSRDHHHKHSRERSKDRHHDRSSKEKHRDRSPRDKHRDKDREKQRDESKHKEHKEHSSSESKDRKSSSSKEHHRHHSSSSSHHHRSSKDSKHRSSSKSSNSSKKDHAVSSSSKDSEKDTNVTEEKIKEELRKIQSMMDQQPIVVSPRKEPSRKRSPPLTPPLIPPPKDEEVTSTVTIKTPERTSSVSDVSKSDPAVWTGDVNMPDVAKFSVTAHQVSGTTDYLTVDLRETLKIVGRIAPATVWDYIKQVSATKEILLVRLHPTTDDEKVNYMSFFSYLQQRDRFGVVGNNGKMVKDCYILPLGSTDAIHECLLPLEGPGLESPGSVRPNMLLALIVRTRRTRKRPSEPSQRPSRQQKVEKKAEAGTPPLLTDDDIKDLVELSGDLKPGASDSAPYDPASAGNLLPEDDDGIYDPESAFEDKRPPPKKPKFSSEEESSPSPPPARGPKTVTSGGFTEQLAKLTAEIEKQKAEIASLNPPFQDDSYDSPGGFHPHQQQPVFSTDLAKGFPAAGPSALSQMSDADLLAKVAQQEMGAQQQQFNMPAAAPHQPAFPPAFQQQQPMYHNEPPRGYWGPQGNERQPEPNGPWMPGFGPPAGPTEPPAWGWQNNDDHWRGGRREWRGRGHRRDRRREGTPTMDE